MCEKKWNGRIEVTIDSEYDPLFKDENTASGIPRYNHIEGFDFAPDEMQEIFHQALLEERANPTQENKAKAFDIFKSMIGEYWAGQREKVEA